MSSRNTSTDSHTQPIPFFRGLEKRIFDIDVYNNIGKVGTERELTSNEDGKNPFFQIDPKLFYLKFHDFDLTSTEDEKKETIAFYPLQPKLLIEKLAFYQIEPKLWSPTEVIQWLDRIFVEVEKKILSILLYLSSEGLIKTLLDALNETYYNNNNEEEEEEEEEGESDKEEYEGEIDEEEELSGVCLISELNYVCYRYDKNIPIRANFSKVFKNKCVFRSIYSASSEFMKKKVNGKPIICNVVDEKREENEDNYDYEIDEDRVFSMERSIVFEKLILDEEKGISFSEIGELLDGELRHLWNNVDCESEILCHFIFRKDRKAAEEFFLEQIHGVVNRHMKKYIHGKYEWTNCFQIGVSESAWKVWNIIINKLSERLGGDVRKVFFQVHMKEKLCEFITGEIEKINNEDLKEIKSGVKKTIDKYSDLKYRFETFFYRVGSEEFEDEKKRFMNSKERSSEFRKMLRKKFVNEAGLKDGKVTEQDFLSAKLIVGKLDGNPLIGFQLGTVQLNFLGSSSLVSIGDYSLSLKGYEEYAALEVIRYEIESVLDFKKKDTLFGCIAKHVVDFNVNHIAMDIHGKSFHEWSYPSHKFVSDRSENIQTILSQKTCTHQQTYPRKYFPERFEGDGASDFIFSKKILEMLDCGSFVKKINTRLNRVLLSSVNNHQIFRSVIIDESIYDTLLENEEKKKDDNLPGTYKIGEGGERVVFFDWADCRTDGLIRVGFRTHKGLDFLVTRLNDAFLKKTDSLFRVKHPETFERFKEFDRAFWNMYLKGNCVPTAKCEPRFEEERCKDGYEKELEIEKNYRPNYLCPFWNTGRIEKKEKVEVGKEDEL